MFNNIGNKIQLYAKIIFVLNVVTTVIFATIFSIGIIANYWISNGYVLLVLLIALVLILIEYCGILVLLGFGKVVEANEKLKEKLEEKNYFSDNDQI